MSGINAISSASSTWSTTNKTSSSSAVADQFSQMVSNMKSGGTGTSTDSSSDDDTVTTIRTLSDGSMVIIVSKDGEIISETKTKAVKPQKDGQDPTTLSTTSEVGLASGQAALSDKFNDTSTSITAGSLFDAGI